MALLFLIACSSDPVPSPATDPWDGGSSIAIEQTAGACPSNPTTLRGTLVEGAACARSVDCIPSCCRCLDTSRTWLAAACVQGACADIHVTCAQSRSDALCR